MRTAMIALSCLLLTLSCTAQKQIQINSLHLDPDHVLLVADSTLAAQTLLLDKTDRFFDLVTASEMSIQMKKPLAEGQTRADLLPAFQDFLRRDVESFTPEESMMVAGVLQEVFNACQAVTRGLFPDTLILIKTKAKHYGRSVYYTRENTIVIPIDALDHYGRSVYYTRENTIVIPIDALDPAMKKEFTSTMYHELFHVYSRQHPEKRTLLYRLIGFEHLGLEHLNMPDALAARVLYNPDGVDFAQKITLKTEAGKTIDAIPVIYANHLGFLPGKRQFFGYVEFNLYQIEKDAKGGWTVVTQPDGFSSTLNLQNLPDFFRQIKDNTGYIIHPDEVLADNFSFLIQGKSDPGITAKFSDGGKKLLADMEAILRE